MSNPLLVIDVAHPPRRQEAVEHDLLDALTRVRSSRVVRLIKIVHGYGSSGRGGVTKTVVQNWLFTRRRAVREVLPGESYDLLDPTTQVMRGEVGQYPDPDLGSANSGITVVWVW
jgi:hypothetical protein